MVTEKTRAKTLKKHRNNREVLTASREEDEAQAQQQEEMDGSHVAGGLWLSGQQDEKQVVCS